MGGEVYGGRDVEVVEIFGIEAFWPEEQVPAYI